MLTAVNEAAAAAAALWLTLVSMAPETRNLSVVQGSRMMSSWSMPIMLAPFRESTPTTRSDTFCTRRSLSIGDWPSNSSVTSVSPMRQTRLPARTSWSVKAWPSSSFCQSRATRNEGVVPQIDRGTQFLLP